MSGEDVKRMQQEICQENVAEKHVAGNMPGGCNGKECSGKIKRCRTTGCERLKKILLSCYMHIIYGGNIDE